MASAVDPKIAKRQSKLYSLNAAIETKDEIEEKMETWFNILQTKLKDLSEKETHDTLVAMVNQNQEDVTLGLLYGILTNQQIAPKYYRDLTLITRDGMYIFVTKLNYIICERYNKLLDVPRQQILWIFREAIKNNVLYMESACGYILRLIVGGDTSQKNVWLADTLLTILLENRPWLDKVPILMANAVYCYLRLIADHVSPNLETLRTKEIRFCVALLREKMIDCINVIGRELGRALIIVAQIPDFEKLWADILHNPTSISPQFTGVWQLLSARVQKKIYVYRLTFDLERKIHFFLNQVRMPNQSKYLEWIQRQYLSTPESQSLRSDIIRYVCCLVHPTNEVLASDVVPRWSFILWLMSTCTNAVEMQICRLSLFYDYFFFDPEKESIMNIEPAILLLFNLLKTQPSLASSLMDFLCRSTYCLCPQNAEQIKNCATSAFKDVMTKKVVSSVSPLFDSPKFDKELKFVIREVFDEFCSPKEKDEDVAMSSESVKLDVDDYPLSIDENGLDEIMELPTTLDEEADENDGEVQETEKPVVKKERRTSQLAIWESDGVLINPFDDPEPADISQSLEQLEPSLRLLVEDLQKLSDDEYGRNDRVYKVLMNVLSYNSDEFEEEQASTLADCFCGLFRPFFARRVFPEKIETEGDLEEILQAPIFVIFRNLCLTPEDDVESRRPLLLLTSEMYMKQPRLGYLLLFFLKASNSGGDRMSAYVEMCNMLDEKFEDMLLKDLKLCQEDDYRLFLYLVPDVYRKFSTFALNNAPLMHLIVETLDAVQLQDLICDIIQGNLTLFRKDTFVNLLTASLKWETLEQYFFWQLVHADDVPVDWLLPAIPKLKFPEHAEAMANILLMLKRLDRDPTIVMVRQILSREPQQKNDLFVVSCLKILIDGYDDKMVDLITNLLNKSPAVLENSQGKGKKTVTKTLTLDPILGHLDMFRRHNKQLHSFFNKEDIQRALQDVNKSAPESLKTKYSELFAMIEILDSVRDGRSLRRGRKVTPATTSHHQTSKTGCDSSDDEQQTKSPTKPLKKKRKVVESDSD